VSVASVPIWTITESDYIDRQVERERQRLTGNIAYTERMLAELGPRASRDKLEQELHFAKRGLAVLDEGPEPHFVLSLRRKYIALVREAISKGMSVPEQVIAQYPEFTTAQNARKRYEKGRATSFANRSAAVDDTMQTQRGYKCKRQDGKPITESQIREIADGITEIESVLGPLADLFRVSDLTIAHTSGKHPFLKASGGQYSIGERTVSMGVLGVPSLAHEIAHWLDESAGAAVGASTVRQRSGRKRILSPSLAESDAGASTDNASLIRTATWQINNQREVVLLLARRKSVGELPDEERRQVESATLNLGPYWREPAEVFARLVEQYVGTKLGRGGVSVDAGYERKPGYWSRDEWDKLEPRVEAEIHRRLGLMRNPAQPMSRKAQLAEVLMEAARQGRSFDGQPDESTVSLQRSIRSAEAGGFVFAEVPVAWFVRRKPEKEADNGSRHSRAGALDTFFSVGDVILDEGDGKPVLPCNDVARVRKAAEAGRKVIRAYVSRESFQKMFDAPIAL
jgi:hypothetical protein